MRREFFTGKPVAVLKPFNRHFGSHSLQPELPSQVRKMRNITKRTAYGILRVSLDNKRFGGYWCRFKNSDYRLIQERMMNIEYTDGKSHIRKALHDCWFARQDIVPQSSYGKRQNGTLV
jgi:hypothetical protein